MASTLEKIKNPLGRSVILDVHASEKNEEFDIEIQRSNSGASPERTRYHISIMDTSSLSEQEDFTNLPTVYVIFITKEDIFGAGEPIYHIDKVVRETKGEFNDRAHVIYVNGSYKDTSTELGRLIHDLNCPEPDKFYNKILENRVAEVKNSREGVVIMFEYFKEHADEFREEGREEGREEFIINMYKKNYTLEQIADVTSKAPDEIKTIIIRHGAKQV